MDHTTFDAQTIISTYLVTPATVSADGLIGRFDTLRVALEHLRSHGLSQSSLTINASDGHLTFAGDDLAQLVDAFEAWPTVVEMGGNRPQQSFGEVPLGPRRE